MTSRVDEPPEPRLPVAAHVADAAALGLALVSLVVATTGPIRLWVGAARLSISSPVRALLLGAAIACVRHWQVRQPSLAARVTGGLRRLSASEPLRAALPAALASRLAVAAIGIVAVFAFGFPQALPFAVPGNALVNLFVRWDAGWYYGIALRGYHYDAAYSGQQNVAFFPAFPLLMRGVAHLFGGSTPAIVLAGVLVSLTAFIAALAVLYRLARLHPGTGSPERAELAVVLLAAYPFSVFHGAIGTESLYLLCAVSGFLYAHRADWRRAAAWGVAAGLTRPNGFLLAVPLAVLAAEHALAGGPSDRLRRFVPALAAALAPVAGMLVFSGFVASLGAPPFEWAAITVRWGRTFTGLTGVTEAIELVRSEGPLGYLQHAWSAVLNAIAAAGALAAVVPVTRRLGPAYGAFILVNLVPPLLMGGTLSIGRLTATLFPMFLWAAGRWRPRTLLYATAGSALGQGLMAALFFSWRPPF